MNLMSLNQWLAQDLTAISYLQPSALNNREIQAHIQGFIFHSFCVWPSMRHQDKSCCFYFGLFCDGPSKLPSVVKQYWTDLRNEKQSHGLQWKIIWHQRCVNIFTCLLSVILGLQTLCGGRTAAYTVSPEAKGNVGRWMDVWDPDGPEFTSEAKAVLQCTY